MIEMYSIYPWKYKINIMLHSFQLEIYKNNEKNDKKEEAEAVTVVSIMILRSECPNMNADRRGRREISGSLKVFEFYMYIVEVQYAVQFSWMSKTPQYCLRPQLSQK